MKMSRYILSVCLVAMSFFLIIPNLHCRCKLVYKIPIYKEVEKGLYAFFKRSIDEAEEARCGCYCIRN